jgi:hypothetical protein
MHTRRRGHGCEIIGYDMFIIGGYGGTPYGRHEALSTTEVYDARAGWRRGPDLRRPRAFGYSGAVDGTIYTVCGMQSVCLHTMSIAQIVCAPHSLTAPGLSAVVCQSTRTLARNIVRATVRPCKAKP